MIALYKYISIPYLICQIVFIVQAQPKSSSINRLLSYSCPQNYCYDSDTQSCQFLDCINHLGNNVNNQCTGPNDISCNCCKPLSSGPTDVYCLTDTSQCVKFDVNKMKDICVLNGDCRTIYLQSQSLMVAVDITGLCITSLPSKNPIRQCMKPDSYCISDDKTNCISLASNPTLIGINQTLGTCIQSLHQIIPAGQKISLQNGYCLDPQKSSVEYMLTPSYIGIDQSFNCVILNQKSTDNIKNCVSGYCSDSHQCLLLSDLTNSFTSRLDDANNNKCAFDNQPNATQCSKEKNSCFDSISQSCQSISSNQAQFSGVDTNGICIQLDNFVPNLFRCGPSFCILSSTNMKTCTKLQGNSSTMGVDANQNCVISGPPAVKCAKLPQICHDQSSQGCFFLSSNILDQRVGKEQLTGFCIPYKDPSKTTGNQIERCADNFCKYSSNSQQFCILMGFIVGEVQYVGIEENTQNCLTLNQITKVGIVECFSILICIQYDSSNQSYQCTQITNSIPNLVSKNANQSCQSYNQPNSLSCADTFQCVNQLNSNQCQNLNNFPKDSLIAGKNQATHLCIPTDTQIAIFCRDGYCMLGDVCKKLSRIYAGREDKTQNCIRANTQSLYGVVQCFTELYCIDGQNQARKCIQLDYNNVGASLDPNNFHHCIGQNDSTISCFRGEYCVNPDPNSNKNCLKSSNQMCTDQNGFCTQKTSNQCYACNYNQCLSSNSPSQCIFMDNLYCQDINGICQFNQSGMCAVCQKRLCLQTDNTCITPGENNQEHSCFYQERQDRPCIAKNIKQPINNQMSCRSQSNICEAIPNNQFNCLVCPQIYSAPSDLQCYDENQRIQIYLDYLIKNQIPPDYDDSQMVLGLRLLYKPLDCYYYQQCHSTKCSEGCDTCSSQNICTSCIAGYFLFQKSGEANIECVKCISSFQIYYDPLFLPQTSLFKCQECELSYGLEQLNREQRVCLIDFILLQNIIAPNQKSGIAFNYQIIQGQTQSIPIDQKGRFLSLFQLISQDYKSSDCDQLNCLSCTYDKQKQLQCSSCKKGFALNDQSQCIKCVDNCVQCAFVYQYENGQFNYLDNGLKSDTNLSFQIIQICQKCEIEFLMNYNLQKCIKCGVNCQTCYYANPSYNGQVNQDDSSLQIFNQDVFNQYQFKKYCQFCQKGYTISQNLEDCVQNIDNCSIGSFKQSQTQQIQLINPWTSYLSNSPTQQICVMCNEGYFTSNEQQSCFPSFQDMLCLSSKVDQTNNYSCLQCQHQHVFNSTAQQCSEQFCYDQIQNCLQCYYYLDKTTPLGQIYQCTQCMQGYMPTIFGCIQCPQGCQSCYQGNNQYNFTSYLIYSMPQISLQEKLNYNNIEQFRDLCLTCQEGFIFDYTNQVCTQILCGDYCSTCVNSQSKSLCINCDLQGIQNQIKDILYYISMLYYQQPSLPDINQMISFNQERTDCIVCPITCLACSRSNKHFSSQYDLYDAQCLSCKNSADAKFVNQGYEIRYDRQRMRCVYCKQEDNLCIYTKQRTIYMYCGSLKDDIGKGTKAQPTNYNRLFEIDFDELIVSDEYYSQQQAYVWYNELQLKELYVKVIITDSQCQEVIETQFNTNIGNYIKSLEIISLEITTYQISSSQIPKSQLIQAQTAKVSGFNQFTISNFQISLNLNTKNFNYGFIIKNQNILSVNFTNIYFLRPSEDQQINTQNILQIKISSLNNTLVLNNVLFYGQYFYNSQIFQVLYLENAKLNFIFEKVTLNKVYFYGSTFISKIYQQSINTQLNFIQNTYIFDSGSIKSNCAMLILMLQNSYNIITIKNVNIQQNNYIGDQKLYFPHFQFYKLNVINIQSVQVLEKLNAPLIIVKQINYAQFKNIQITQQQPSEYSQNTLIEIRFIFFYLEFNTIQITNYYSMVNIIYIQFNYISPQLIQQPDNPQYLYYGGKFIDFYLVNSHIIYDQQIQNNFPLIIKSQSINQIMFINLNIINNYIKADNKIGGSGIFIDAINSKITLNNGNFTNNLGTHKGYGPFLLISEFLLVSNCLFQNPIYQNIDIQTYQQTSIDIQGGFANIQAKNLKIFSSQFLNGKATQGGAIYIKPFLQSNLLMKDIQFIENWSVSQEDISSQLGGAVYLDFSLSEQTDIAIEDSIFQNNLAGFQGGSIFVKLDYKKHIFVLERVNFTENLSLQGSSIFSFQLNMKSSLILRQVNFYYTFRNSSSKINYITKYNSNNLQKNVTNLAHFILSGLKFVEMYQNNYYFSQQNIPKNQDKLINSILDIVDFQGLYQIANSFVVNDILGIYSQAIAYKEFINFVSIENVLIENTKYLQNQIFASYDEILNNLINNSILSFTAQQILITNSTFFKNVCQTCQNGNLLIESSYAQIYYSSFQKNNALNGGGIYFKSFQNSLQNGQQLQIKYSIFTQNIAYNSGGALYIQESSAQIQNCTFYQNIAYLNGGSILHNISNYQTSQALLNKQVILLNNFIIQNQASIAGAYYSVQGIFPQYFYTNNTIIQNQASKFGKDLVGFGIGIQIIINNLKVDHKNFIYHHTTGKFQDSIIILVVNQNGEVFDDQSKYVGLDIQQNSIFQKQHYSFKQKNGTFNLTNLISVYGQFNSDVELILSSDIIQIPRYLNISDPLQISDYSSNYNSILKIKINNYCNPGYQLQKFQTNLDYCSPCLEGFYNTQPNQRCIKCPDQAYFCQLQTILLKNGYWRENSTSSLILACDKNKNSCIQNQAGVNFVNTNQQCAEGYIGPICDDCDIEQIYWGQRYQKTGNNQCLSCQSDFKYSISMFTGIIFYSLIFSIYITDSTINQFKQQVVDNYFLLFKCYVVKKTNISSTIIKILINYLQLISIITNMNIPLPRIIGTFITIFGSPSQLSQNNMDCLYIQITKFIGLPFLYAKFVLGQIQLGIICLMFFGLYRIYCLFMKRRFHFYHLITGLILIYYQNFSGIVQQLLGSVSCRQIGYKSYVLDYAQYECNTEHYTRSLIILFPPLLVWAIVIPLLLLYFLAKNQFNLHKLKQLTLVGFLYEGYKKNMYFWEIIQIAKNLSIAFFLKFYGDFNPLKYILCAITILVYSLLLQNFKPLSSQRLNNLNVTSSNYSVLIIMLGLIAQEFQNIIISIFCLLLILVLNLFLGVQVLNIILKEYLTKIKLILYPFVLNLLDKLHIKVNRTLFNVINKQHVLKLWKKITYKVHSLNKKVNKSSNFINKEFKQNLFMTQIQDHFKQAQIQIKQIQNQTKGLNKKQQQYNSRQFHSQANSYFKQNLDTQKSAKLAKQ
ncbi:hypothetical protein ABPG72_015864 [Tetrahymena utriculariae]